MINSKFEYRGRVETTLKLNGKTVKTETHNAGAPALYKGFAKWLAGYYSFKDIPDAIDLRGVSGNTETSILKECPKVTRDYTDSEAQFYAVISSDNIGTATYNNYVLCLLNSNNEVLARIENYNKEYVQRIKDGFSAKIIWYMSILQVEG